MCDGLDVLNERNFQTMLKTEGEVQFLFCAWELEQMYPLLNVCSEANLPPPQYFLVFQNSVLLHLWHCKHLKMKINLIFLCDNNLVTRAEHF